MASFEQEVKNQKGNMRVPFMLAYFCLLILFSRSFIKEAGHLIQFA